MRVTKTLNPILQENHVPGNIFYKTYKKHKEFYVNLHLDSEAWHHEQNWLLLIYWNKQLTN